MKLFLIFYFLLFIIPTSRTVFASQLRKDCVVEHMSGPGLVASRVAFQALNPKLSASELDLAMRDYEFVVTYDTDNWLVVVRPPQAPADSVTAASKQTSESLERHLRQGWTTVTINPKSMTVLMVKTVE